MKKYFLAFVATAISTVLFVNANAQETMKSVAGNFKNPLRYASIINAEDEIKNDYKFLYKINFKAVQDFKNTYTNVSDENWEILKDGYLARFVLNSVLTMNYYDKKGRWLHCIQRYDETRLPKDVRAHVKSNYYDYSITSVQELNMNKNNQEPVYIIHLKYNYDAALFKTIRVCVDEMEEINL